MTPIGTLPSLLSDLTYITFPCFWFFFKDQFKRKTSRPEGCWQTGAAGVDADAPGPLRPAAEARERSIHDNGVLV